MRPVKGRVSLPDGPARRTSRRDGATFDAHRRSFKNLLQSDERRLRAPSGRLQIDGRRPGELVGLWIDVPVDNDHPSTMDEVARPLSVSEALPRPLLSDDQIFVAGGPEVWPRRLRSHLEKLATRYLTYLGMVRPKAQPHPSKWHHGYPDESGVQAARWLVACARQGLARCW